MLKYIGPYAMISAAYNALQKYINNNGLEVNGPGWEEYVTNPNEVTDSTKRQTDIYFPLQ